MKGVILAGGLATRLYPLTYATNKHLLPVADKPMIFYPIQTLLNAGVNDIMVVTGGPHAGHFIAVLKNGRELGIRHLEYAYQEKEGGISEALALAKDFADGEPIAVILGDNTTDANIGPYVKKFTKGAAIFLKKVPDPQRFGVPVFDSKDKSKIIGIEEKPKNPKSSYAVTGLYLYDANVFDYIQQCKPSWRNELEITDVNNFYIKANELRWAELQGFWSDAGTFQTLLLANQHWGKKRGLI